MDFTKVHPDTVRWWTQREKCRSCDGYLKQERHCSHGRTTPNQGGGELCTSVPPANGAGSLTPCIRARSPGYRCGPDALLYRPRVGA